MHIVDFSPAHIAQAQSLALQAYRAEQSHLPTLPQIDGVPDLRPFAQNGLGVAAMHDDRLLGFLCSVPLFPHAFRSTDAFGAFSPMGANAAIPADRPRIYARLYQSAAEKWAAAGASSHAICTYAHDTQTHAQLFQLGFGLRCLDAIRPTASIEVPRCDGYSFAESSPSDAPHLLDLLHKLAAHMAQSPTFILRPPITSLPSAQFFVAKHDALPVALLQIEPQGETFIAGAPDYRHITGAFCLPAHRGNGIFLRLLNYAINALQSDAVARLGVDFESINPAADHFWRKHFAPYTYGLVRRIDEHALRTAPPI